MRAFGPHVAGRTSPEPVIRLLRPGDDRPPAVIDPGAATGGRRLSGR